MMPLEKKKTVRKRTGYQFPSYREVLRDFFAGMIACGAEASARGGNTKPEVFGKYTYERADAMIKYRDQQDTADSINI